MPIFAVWPIRISRGDGTGLGILKEAVELDPNFALAGRCFPTSIRMVIGR